MTSAILLAAGESRRFADSCPPAFPWKNKLLTPLPDGRPVWRHSFDLLARSPRVQHIVVVTDEPEVRAEAESSGASVVPGGSTRAQSSLNGIQAATGAEVLVVHDAARPFASDALLERVLDASTRAPAVIPAIPAADTIKRCVGGKVKETLDREALYHAQTPQAANREALLAAMRASPDATDESSALERAGIEVRVVPGEVSNRKITTFDDLKGVLRVEHRTGLGYDVHRLASGRALILGGVEIPFERGLEGHSDADVLLHAVTDALLGAASLGDIGTHFPNTDPTWKNASSDHFLRHAMNLLRADGYALAHLDATVIAEAPRLAPFMQRMRDSIASILEVESSRISVKATTHEGLGALGRCEGIAAFAIATIERWLPLQGEAAKTKDLWNF
jgi:2-C-methyl-D-erythritol 4-phosphate cytidylyltransferase/2-C-methyl-D-erythritol 2,4-cyclodiphosphate synthase